MYSCSKCGGSMSHPHDSCPHCGVSYPSNNDGYLIMKPTIGKRAAMNQPQRVKKPSVDREYVEINTHQNITMKRRFLYEEDVKSAININTLEERIWLKRWFISQLRKGVTAEGCDYGRIVKVPGGF